MRLEDISERVITAKKKGNRELIGLLIFLDKDTFLKLEDISYMLGSIDAAVNRAISDLHSKMFLSENQDVKVGEEKIDIDSIVGRIEEKLAEIIARIPAENVVQVGKEKQVLSDMPELVKIEEEEEPELEDVLEEVAVVEIDESLIGEKKKDEREDSHD